MNDGSNVEAQQFTDADMARVMLLPQVRAVRRALGLTQEEFAARFQVLLRTLRDWEQGRAEPDQPARAYLRAIGVDAEGGWQALRAGGRGDRW